MSNRWTVASSNYATDVPTSWTVASSQTWYSVTWDGSSMRALMWVAAWEREERLSLLGNATRPIFGLLWNITDAS